MEPESTRNQQSLNLKENPRKRSALRLFLAIEECYSSTLCAITAERKNIPSLESLTTQIFSNWQRANKVYIRVDNEPLVRKPLSQDFLISIYIYLHPTCPFQGTQRYIIRGRSNCIVIQSLVAIVLRTDSPPLPPLRRRRIFFLRIAVYRKRMRTRFYVCDIWEIPSHGERVTRGQRLLSASYPST